MNILGDLFAAPKQDGLSDAQMLSMAMQLRSQQLQDERALALAAQQERNYRLALRRQQEAEDKTDFTQNRQTNNDEFAAGTKAEDLKFKRSQAELEQAQKLQGDIQSIYAPARNKDGKEVDTGWGVVNRTFFDDVADSGAANSRTMSGEAAMSQYLGTEEAARRAKELNMTPAAYARYVDNVTGQMMAMANVAGPGTNIDIEKSYSTALPYAANADESLRRLGITDPARHMAKVDAGRYLTQDNPNGMAQAAALNMGNVPQYARDALLADKVLSKLNDMYPSADSPVYANFIASKGIAAKADALGLPPETLSAVLAKYPKLMDVFLSTIADGGADESVVGALDMDLRRAAARPNRPTRGVVHVRGNVVR